MLNGNPQGRREWQIAIAMSAALFLCVGGFIYLTLIPEITESHGLAGIFLAAAIILYGLGRKIRMPVPVRAQLSVWTAWLGILGITPAFDPRRFPQSRVAIVGGSVMLIFSLKALLFVENASPVSSPKR